MNLRIFWQIIFTLFVLCSCSEIGEQPPENIQLVATPNGKEVIRLYSVLFVTSYSRTGNSVRRSGSSTLYLEKYDANTGRLLSTKPFKLEGNYKILKITNENIWLSRYNIDTQKQELLVLNLIDFSKTFNSTDLAKINNGLGFQPNHLYNNPLNVSGVVLQGDDARVYAINEKDGKATLLSDSIKPEHFNDLLQKLHNVKMATQRLSFEGATRKRLVANRTDWHAKKEPIATQEDFIDPFIAGVFDESIQEDAPVIVDNALLIVSKTKSTNDFQYQFSIVDTAMLKTKWASVLNTGNLGTSSTDELDDIKISDDRILVLTKNVMGEADAKTGKWIWTKSFVNKVE